MAYDPTSTFDAIIFKPGGTSAGDVASTWAEVKAFIQASSNGKCIVYVDDSVISPALVPGALHSTDCGGRVELRPYATDASAFTVLQIEDGATLKNLWKLTDMELRCNSQSGIPSLDWTTSANGSIFYLEGSLLSNAATATNPGIVIPTNTTLFIDSNQAGFNLNAPAVPLVALATATSLFHVIILNGGDGYPANLVSGPGIFDVGYDRVTAQSFTVDIPPPCTGVGTYTTRLLDSLLKRTFLANANDIFAPASAGIIKVNVKACGGAGGGGGGHGSGAGPTSGGGGGGGSLYGQTTVDVDLSHRIDVVIGNGGAGGAGGAGGGGAGGVGTDGAPSYLLDFTANIVLAAFPGASGGGGGSIVDTVGGGGVSFAATQHVANNAGFLGAGGQGASPGANDGAAGNINAISIGHPGGGSVIWSGGAGGTSGIGNGAGGGGGGAGTFGDGGIGGSGNAVSGNPGTPPVANSGAGGGGGSGANAGLAASAGGSGGSGQLEVSY